MHRRCSVKTLAFDAGSLGDISDALSLARWRKAISRTRGSSSSSNAALRYSAVHSYRFLIRDRDSIFSAEVDQLLKAFRVLALHTPVRAPKANADCERSVGKHTP